MIKQLWILLCALLAIPALCAGQDVQPKPVSKKSSTASAKSTKAASAAPSKPVEQSTKSAYAELTIGELIAEDPSRWSDKMSAHAAVGGFVTQRVALWPSAYPKFLAMCHKSVSLLQ